MHERAPLGTTRDPEGKAVTNIPLANEACHLFARCQRPGRRLAPLMGLPCWPLNPPLLALKWLLSLVVGITPYSPGTDAGWLVMAAALAPDQRTKHFSLAGLDPSCGSPWWLRQRLQGSTMLLCIAESREFLTPGFLAGPAGVLSSPSAARWPWQLPCYALMDFLEWAPCQRPRNSGRPPDSRKPLELCGLFGTSQGSLSFSEQQERAPIDPPSGGPGRLRGLVTYAFARLGRQHLTKAPHEIREIDF